MKRPIDTFPALNAYIASMRCIPAGEFLMGSMSGDCDQRPVHSVVLGAFRMGATPVTVAVWKEYCVATKTPLPDAPKWGLLDDHPIVNVSWFDIMGADGNGGFCAWASDVACFQLKLPTEAQFEYASLGGNVDVEFPWGNAFDCTKLWCSIETIGDAGGTASVERTSRNYQNAYGLSDIVGNVYQWCADWYEPYALSSARIPPSKESMPRGCARGASWRSTASVYYRIANRSRFKPTRKCSFLGFRLVSRL